MKLMLLKKKKIKYTRKNEFNNIFNHKLQYKFIIKNKINNF